MTPRPSSLQDLYWAAEQDLQADPRLSISLKWAFWHAALTAEREVRRTQAILAEDTAARAAALGLLQESVTAEQAAAHVLNLLRQRKPRKQQSAVAQKPRAARAA